VPEDNADHCGRTLPWGGRHVGRRPPKSIAITGAPHPDPSPAVGLLLDAAQINASSMPPPMLLTQINVDTTAPVDLREEWR
jgi:hypothetical protein